MHNSYVAWFVWGVPGSENRIYPWCTSWLFEPITLLRLDEVGGGLHHASLSVSGPFESPWQALLFQRKGGGRLGDDEREQEEEKEGELCFVCKMNKNSEFKNKKEETKKDMIS